MRTEGEKDTLTATLRQTTSILRFLLYFSAHGRQSQHTVQQALVSSPWAP